MTPAEFIKKWKPVALTEVVPGCPDRILPKDAKAAVMLKTRMLTNLYNQRPQWLADAHRDLDAAVAAGLWLARRYFRGRCAGEAA